MGKILTKEQIRHLLTEYKITDARQLQDVLKELFKDVLQEALEGELEEELGYSKYDYKNKNTTNSRNGHTKKKVKSDTAGEIELEIPRDRDGEFEPCIVQKHQSDISSMDDKIISMYAKGMSTRDINSHMQSIYGFDVSANTVSKITDKILPVVKDWQNRPLEEIYSIVFLDGMVFNVKQNGTVIKKTCYSVIGIDLHGFKDILGIWIGEAESAKFWMNVLSDLKNRGVKDILIASIDGLSGFKEAIRAIFPETDIQRCIVHQIRNACKFVSYKDIKKFCADMKEIYTASNEEDALDAFQRFADKWNGKYSYAVKSWEANWNELSTMFKFPKEIRTIIYTTNPIESYNRAVKKITKTKGTFPTDEALIKLVYLASIDVSKKWNQKIRDWNSIINQLTIIYADRITKYLYKERV
jgi:putative transposase